MWAKNKYIRNVALTIIMLITKCSTMMIPVLTDFYNFYFKCSDQVGRGNEDKYVQLTFFCLQYLW